jgi:hypothetical protein
MKEKDQGEPLTPEEIAWNMFAVENAIAQQRLEGLEPLPECIADMYRCARGEITTEEAIANLKRRYDRTGKPDTTP